MPLVDDHTVDLIVNYRITVQVKSASSRDVRGRLSISLGARLPDHVDVLAVYALDACRWWFIPAEHVGIGRTVKLHEGWKRGPSTWLDSWHIFDEAEVVTDGREVRIVGWPWKAAHPGG